MRTPRRRILVRAGLGLVAVAVLLQLVPYGRDHSNPPVTHPDAALSDAERQVLVEALEAMDRARGGGDRSGPGS
jgi:hypothetical protein